VKLYPFQKAFVDWAWQTKAVLLGDDMGLGKTVEAIALDMRRRVNAPSEQRARQFEMKTLVVTPMSVMGSWEWHARMIWPGAKVFVIDPKNRPAFIAALKKPYHFYIVHWEALRLVKELRDVKWWHIIADEVHRAKNRKAQQTQGLKALKTEYKTALSGTPADNVPQDFWSILNWLYPRIFTSYWRFYNKHVVEKTHNTGTCLAEGCDKYHKNAYKEITGVADVEDLHRAIAPFYMRRLKDEVIKDLPDKTYTTIEVELPPQQRRIYEQMNQEMLAWIGKHQDEPCAAPIVLAQLQRLKQFALAYAEVIFRDVRDKETGEVYPKAFVKLSEPSAKLDVVMDKIQDNPTRKFVVFSESKQVINLLARRLEKCNISHEVLTGDTSQSDRDDLITRFQAGLSRVFLGTIYAGGEGITLTAADTVIFLDRAWNPSRNRQAEDRLHRIGQKNNVQVIDVVAKNTVDAGRLQRLELKWSWLRRMLGDEKDAPLVSPRGQDGPVSDSEGSSTEAEGLEVA